MEATPADEVELRPATEGDREFLFEVHRTALGPYVEATWGWDEESQRRRFQEHFRPARYSIIRCAGREVGFLSVEEREDHVLLGTIEIRPEYQRRGIGTHLLRELLAMASSRGLPLRLRVLKVNPARRLYQRLGFRVTGDTETHFLMEALPGTGGEDETQTIRSPGPGWRPGAARRTVGWPEGGEE